MWPNARPSTNHDSHRRSNDSPNRDIQERDAVPRLRRPPDRSRKLQHQQRHISAPAMILVESLSVFHATEERLGQEVLRDPEERLGCDEDDSEEAEESVG